MKVVRNVLLTATLALGGVVIPGATPAAANHCIGSAAFVSGVPQGQQPSPVAPVVATFSGYAPGDVDACGYGTASCRLLVDGIEMPSNTCSTGQSFARCHVSCTIEVRGNAYLLPGVHTVTAEVSVQWGTFNAPAQAAGSWQVSYGGPTPGGCNDGRDNDGDGAADYPADGGCSDANDTDEQKDCNDAPSDLCFSPGTLLWQVIGVSGAYRVIDDLID